MKLDIACGKNTRPGFTGVDIWEGADIVCNLEHFPWPFEDESVDEIFCSHYIEHVPDLVSFANELYRIMKPGAKASIIAPYYSSIRAWQDPTHVRAISENTFLYFRKDWREANRLDHYPICANFSVNCSYIVVPEWREKDRGELEFAMLHYINVISDILAELVKIGPDGEEEADALESAQELWASGDYEAAFKVCCKLADEGKHYVELLLMMAEYHYQQQVFDEALKLFEEVILLDGLSLQGNMGLLRTLCKLGRDSDARDHLDSLKMKDPGLVRELEEFLG